MNLIRKIFVLLLCISNTAWAKDYYVRPDIYHSSERDGTTYSAAWALKEVNWLMIKGGDTVYLCGTYHETITLGGDRKNWGGSPGNNIVITGSCEEEAGRIQNVSGNAIEVVRREYVSVRNFIIENITKNGLVAYGRGGRETPEANSDLNISNIDIRNVGGSGIIISCSNGYSDYAAQKGIIIEDVTIANAGQHGIYVSCNQDGTIIRRAHVDGAATKGNYWGIDVSSRFINYTGKDWKHVKGNIYKINMSKINPYWNGKPDWETIYQIIHTTREPYHLQKNENCTDPEICTADFELFSYIQDKNVVYVNVGKNPNNAHIAFVTAKFGSVIVEDSYVSNISNNNGTTDGVGIGADLGTTGVIFRRNTSEKNDGSGFELAGASAAEVYDNVANLNGKWGYNIHKSRGAGVKVYKNKAINNRRWQFYASRNSASLVEFIENYGEGGSKCFHISNKQSVQLRDNHCFKDSSSVRGVTK